MKLILSYDQARHLINNLPIGTGVKMSVQTANKILDSKPSTNNKNAKR